MSGMSRWLGLRPMLGAVVLSLGLAPSAAADEGARPAQTRAVAAEVKAAAEREGRYRHEYDYVYWQSVVQGKPSAAERETALFHLGIACQRTERWFEAAATFESLAGGVPNSIWQAEAVIHLLDLALERERDVEKARGLARTGQDWINRRAAIRPQPVEAAAAPRIQAASGADAKAPFERFSLRAEADVRNDIPHRVALLCYCEGKAIAARAVMEQGARGISSDPVQDRLRTEVFKRIYTDVRTGRMAAPAEVRKGDANTLVLLTAAALWLGPRPDLAHDIASHVLSAEVLAGTNEQISYVYFLRASSLLKTKGPAGVKAACDDLETSHRLARKASWGPEVLSLLATTHFQSGEADRGLLVLRRIGDEYPNTLDAERSSYQVARTLELLKRYAEAQQELVDFQTRFPDSDFKKLVDERLKAVGQRLRSRSGSTSTSPRP